MKVHAYLNFAGNAAEAFEFYRSVFGGELLSHVRFRDMPMEGACTDKFGIHWMVNHSAQHP